MKYTLYVPSAALTKPSENSLWLRNPQLSTHENISL